jgi:type I restriction enzyme, S subunit
LEKDFMSTLVPVTKYCEITSSKRIYAKEYMSSGVPFYRGKEISLKSKNEIISEPIFITRDRFEEIKKRFGAPKAGDILMTAVGTIGNLYIVKNNEEFYFKDGNVLWFRKFDNLNSAWLYYWLLSTDGKRELAKCIIGSSQSAYTIDNLSKLKIPQIKLPTQERIASAIKNYDDLIENNEKRSKILEEMAQKLYAEWFVKFKFPGHEKAKFIDSGTKFGKIPSGWEVRSVESLIKRIPAGKKYENKTVSETGKVPVLDQGKSGVIGFHNDKPGVNASLENPVIVFANHTCYQNLIVYPFSAIQNVLPFVPNDERSIYWLHWATKDLIEFNDYKGHWPEFIAKKYVVPEIELTQEFGDTMAPIVALKYKLERRDVDLKEMRDLLIPQLVTGKRKLK